MLQRPRRRPAFAATAALAAVACVASLAPAVSSASSHREAPLVAGEPQLDNTDVYAFVSPDAPDTVTMIANWVPFEEPNGGPNFYPFADDAAYDINIDNDGDARPDLTYRWTFDDSYRNPNTFLYNTGVVTSLDDPDLNFRQTYRLEAITETGRTTLISNGKVAPSRVGPASMPDYGTLSNAAITNLPGGGRTFAGQGDDPFFIDLHIFDMLYGGDLSEVGQDTVRGYNTNTIAIQVPKKALAVKGDAARNPVVGVWSTTSRRRIDVVNAQNERIRTGPFQQVSRLGMPLVNEVVIPVGRKDEFNATAPRNDAKFGQFVTNPEVPRLVEAIYKIPAPATPRQDLAEVFLTGLCKACGPVAVDLNSQRLNKDVDPAAFVPSEQLRLNMSIPPAATPNPLGVLGGDNAGFPNGRRLADDVTDATLRVAEGVLLPNHPAAVDTLGDKVDANALMFRGTFPYVALPNNVAVNQS
ncbi:DUF4331 domain-containing protein [Actinoplanes palleronii]|uniref:DUF4331 domain-containing protein n=1 Tax=Actinoplanes palleronii TaxID=113570 RepID=A0ABQ4BL68_9ACTN|nr:DUF4331 domain-containing protein [Actinoplanes palleronii]GIE71419.1 hypothetical protein Apa02nite_075270 [Actinoplanes palleronii]